MAVDTVLERDSLEVDFSDSFYLGHQLYVSVSHISTVYLLIESQLDALPIWRTVK